jgi:polysaccharide pyruvyl transferase WcaK-like protein
VTADGRQPISCLLLGYSGFANTGSESRVITIIDDIRACFGESVRISVASPAPEKTARVLPRYPNVTVAAFPMLFPRRIVQLVRSHDVVFLVEGSTFQQNWSNALLYFFLWGIWSAGILGKKSVAYAVDAGPLSPVNRWLTRRACRRLDLVITRTEQARNRLLEVGLRQPVIATTDTAFTFLTDAAPAVTPVSAGRRIVGVAPIEFHQWPVRIKLLFGKREECFSWPYYFTWNEDRRRKSQRMIEQYSALIRHCVDTHDLEVALIAMEELDEALCRKILATVGERYAERITLASSRTLTPDQMVPLLRRLDYLVTSRYHACVLSMARAVPQMAICHDDRLRAIYTEMGMTEFLLDHTDGDLDARAPATFDALVARAPEVAMRLRGAYDSRYVRLCQENRRVLRSWAAATFAVREQASAVPPARLVAETNDGR